MSVINSLHWRCLAPGEAPPKGCITFADFCAEAVGPLTDTQREIAVFLEEQHLKEPPREP